MAGTWTLGNQSFYDETLNCERRFFKKEPFLSSLFLANFLK